MRHEWGGMHARHDEHRKAHARHPAAKQHAKAGAQVAKERTTRAQGAPGTGGGVWVHPLPRRHAERWVGMGPSGFTETVNLRRSTTSESVKVQVNHFMCPGYITLHSS